MLGGAIKRVTSEESIVVRHTEEVTVDADGKVPAPKDHVTGIEMYPAASTTHPIKLINLTKGYRTQITSGTMAKLNEVTFKNPAAGIAAAGEAPAIGDKIRIFWDEIVDASNTKEDAVEVTISPDTFPGTYRVVGDTLIRSADTGRDEPFQFIIEKAEQILAA